MRICFICEGSYPYVAGGVSSWLHDLIKKMPENEVVIWAIGANESMKGKYAYTLPENVVHIQEVFLDSMLQKRRAKKEKIRFSETQLREIKEFISCGDPDWNVIFDTFAKGRTDPVQFLLDKSFLKIIKEICNEKYEHLPFTDLFWTMRSMFLPVLYLLNSDFPEADMYHAVSCGYAGVLASAASGYFRKPYVLTEHGIYTREREEEIIRASWVLPAYKSMWIALFYMFSRCAYRFADVVTALYGRASEAQREIGCAAEKQMIIPNGVNTDRFGSVPMKPYDGYVDIGAIVRIVPIKDIKTMLYAFSRVSAENEKVRLHIMGPVDENPEYYEECLALKEELGLDRAIFTGRIKTWEYLEKIDFTLLTSISEGMPLATLEGMAAGRPAITTNVGSCSELLYGNGDSFGIAGRCVPAMDIKEMAEAMLNFAADEDNIKKMGRNGQKRVFALFKHEDMIANYKKAYEKAVSLHRER